MSKAFLALIIVMVVPAQPISSALHADVRVMIAGTQLPNFAGDDYVSTFGQPPRTFHTLDK